MLLALIAALSTSAKVSLLAGAATMLGTSAVDGDPPPPDTGEDDPPAKGAAAPTIADAGAKYLEGLSPEDRDRPLSIEGEDDEELEAPPPAEAVGDEVEPITRETDGAEWNGDAGRWVLDGKFVAGDPPAGWTKPVAPKPTAAPAPKGGKAAAATPAKVVLPGHAERQEADLELEIDDPEVAERLRRTVKDGLRHKAYTEKVAALEDREAKLAAYEQEMVENPVGFHLTRVPKEQRLEVAKALLLEHLDELQPTIDELTADEGERHKRRVALRDDLDKAKERVAANREVRAFYARCVQQVATHIPEGTPAATERRFLQAARALLGDAADAGQLRQVGDVDTVIAGLVADYRFDQPAPAGAGTTTDDPPAVPAARPGNDRARQLAGTRPPTAVADPAAGQRRIRRVQAARQAGSRVAPPGAGSAPTTVPVLPPEAEADIESASKHMRKTGMADSWDAFLARS